MSLVLTTPFAHVSLQGAPILGRRRFGVPPGGAFDQESWRLANVLAGNLEPQAALEIAFAGIEATVTEDCRLAWVGASLVVDGVGALGSVVHVSPGQRITIGKPYRARAYVARAGGWQSLSGGLLSSGTAITEDPHKRGASMPIRGRTLHVVPFGDAPSLDGSTFRVSQRLDRVGIRLEGPPVPGRANIVSEPTCFGAVQATPDGSLIILGPDGPTIGGYATQAVVSLRDHDCLAQLCPGDEITLVEFGTHPQ